MSRTSTFFQILSAVSILSAGLVLGQLLSFVDAGVPQAASQVSITGSLG